MIGPDLYDTANLNMRAGSRHLGTAEVEKIGLPITQVGNALLLYQVALTIVQVQLDCARELRDEDWWRRAHEVYHV